MKIEFYIGAGVDSDGKPIPQVEAWEIRAKIRAKLAESFGGFTEFPGCSGHWQGVDEPIYHFVVLVDNSVPAEDINRIATEIRRIARQTCIAVNVTPSTVTFV